MIRHIRCASCCDTGGRRSQQVSLRWHQDGERCSVRIPGSRRNKSWRDRGAILVQATIRRAKGHQPLHAGTADRVRGRDEKKRALVGDLYALIGTTYIVTQNADLNNKFANGT